VVSSFLLVVFRHSDNLTNAVNPCQFMLSFLCLFHADSFDFQFNSLYSYVTRYRSGDLTPSDVAERALRALGDLQQINAIKKFDPDRVKKVLAAVFKRVLAVERKEYIC